MSTPVKVLLNGQWVQASTQETVLALMINAGLRSVQSELSMPRFALCGMGICHDCAVEIDGQRAQLACLRYCREGMQVQSHG